MSRTSSWCPIEKLVVDPPANPQARGPIDLDCVGVCNHGDIFKSDRNHSSTCLFCVVLLDAFRVSLLLVMFEYVVKERKPLHTRLLK